MHATDDSTIMTKVELFGLSSINMRYVLTHWHLKSGLGLAEEISIRIFLTNADEDFWHNKDKFNGNFTRWEYKGNTNNLCHAALTYPIEIKLVAMMCVRGDNVCSLG